MIDIIGGGLVGSGPRRRRTKQGVDMTIDEMRPVRPTAVHRPKGLAELVS